MAQIPTYYVMERNKGMADGRADDAVSRRNRGQQVADRGRNEVRDRYGRTGFTGALQGYQVRRGSNPKSFAELLTFSGRTIDVPSMFIAGKSDWGVYQTPGAAEKMQTSACTHMVGFHLVEGAGHWAQQEQPEQVSKLLVAFLRSQA
jgi:pimeloyl-ACP methyl ester carboxylesterase